MTQEKLAELTDLSPRYISNIENVGGNVSLDTIELLAEALEVDYTDLFTTTNKEIKIKKVNMIKRKIANRLFNNLLAIVFCGATRNRNLTISG